MSIMLNSENVWFRYSEDSDWALKDISLQVEKGEFVAVLGSNGCGKSTLAKLFNAILLPEKGDILVENINTKDYLDTPLSSIYGRSREKCESAIELLLKKMDNKRYSEPTKILESTLISRTSVKNLKKV